MSTDVSPDDSVDEGWDEGPEVQDSISTAGAVTGAGQGSSRDPVRHVQRDYSYVRSELTRIAALGAIIVLVLIVVAIFR